MILRAAIAGVAGMLICGCDSRSKITEDASFVVAGAFSDSGLGSSCEEVIWATDSVLIATASNKRIQAFDANSGKELWGKEFDRSIEAVTCDSSHVYVALNASYPNENAESIRRLDVANGNDSTPKGIPQPFLVEALLWSPELKALCVLENEALWIYSANLLSVAKRVPYSGRLPIVTSDGKSVILAECNGSCSLIDLKAGSIDHIHGPPNNGDANSVPIDAPFLSNAFHSSSGPLIRIIDNSWATGRIFFHSTPKDAAMEKDSKNGHAVAAVHWPTDRLAVSGTEKNLLLFSTTGTELGEIRGATTERTYSLSFSPTGSKIATLSSDGRIKVFNAP
jgi:WD40 repeat protein